MFKAGKISINISVFNYAAKNAINEELNLNPMMNLMMNLMINMMNLINTIMKIM